MNTYRFTVQFESDSDDAAAKLADQAVRTVKGNRIGTLKVARQVQQWSNAGGSDEAESTEG